ncbi:4-diphosphocytidyl-2-C-methyl-D-erythritol kinase [Anaerobranca californiensis DSM 14826]|uniref:4-diphosphocytidyl-2-C-methyl-D-erythritol kinase n=1 Tax=Anaerobranca californiensis DSM 14826 TaxID=1120989 RepID=A0A1M6PJP7_9FIRM|nr:4-(cytidine 5'-diphospho)-2-C-methyl-D-erythritol kinase [Anaerobranca californiensis]SHK08145.1 4-diphosphocytidyl-2-C-methyl-D-erythritol kinase [Anaerobranca californiensis DSM 14826]
MELKAKAKINLTLDVLYKRPDGYHQVEMIMQTLELADILHIEESEETQIICNHPFVPEGQGNLVYKAVEELKRYCNIDKNVKIHIEKNIPVAAGLGGGSSDCAATLKGLNKMWNLGLDDDTLEKIGLNLGADVPFFIKGGTQLAQGIGEKLTPLPSPPPMWVVLGKANMGVSTKEVYSNLNLENISKRPNTQSMIKAIETGDIKEICNNLCNVLETVTLKKYSTVRNIKNRMAQMGANGVLMSGSGPTVYGLCNTYDKAVRIAKNLETLTEEVYVTKFC